MAKKGALDAAPEDDKEVVGEDTIFAGADTFEHDDDEDLSTADRGDDPSLDGRIAVEEDDAMEEEEVVVAKAADAEPEGEDDDPAELDAVTADDDAEPDDTAVSNYVSKDRFNAVNERMKLAEQALKEKEAALAQEAPEPEPAFDFDAKEVEYMELVTDGEFDKAKAVRKEIRAAERAELEADVAAKADNTTARVNEQIAFNNKIQELNEEFDAFNPKNEAYDQVLVDEAVDRRDLFVARGMSLADALDRAAREVAKLYDLSSNFEAAADAELARIQAEEKGKPLPKKKIDVKKKVALAKAQPPIMDEGSPQEESKTALTMTEAEFDALPEATKARMRGDIV